MSIKIIVKTKGEWHEIHAEKGAILRTVLINNELTPHVPFTQNLNCGGNGLCATCGVWVQKDLQARHWHDKLAKQFGYPRLSCQIRLEKDLVIELVDDKKIWGRPNKNKEVKKGMK